MITEGEAAILLETTRRAFGNQSQSKQRSTLIKISKWGVPNLHFRKLFSDRWISTWAKYFMEQKYDFLIHFHIKKEVFKKKVYRRKVTGPSIFKGFKNNSWPVCLLLCPLVTSTKNDGKGRKPLKDSEWELGLSCRWCTCYYTVLHSRRSIFVLCHIFVTIHRVFWNLFPEWYRAQPFIRLHTIRRL